MFITFWVLSTIVVFLFVRYFVKEALNNDEDFLDDMLVPIIIMYFGSFVPFINLLILLLLIVVAVWVYIEEYGATRIIMKLFFIKSNTKGGESK